MDNVKGYVSFVLHAHLPFIHHPESEDYLEEEWLFEAISETGLHKSIYTGYYLPRCSVSGGLETISF